MKRYVPALSAALLLTACNAAPERAVAAEPATADAVHALIVEADAARAKAASVGYEWRDTAKFIDEARKLMKEGKYDDALALARKAKRQGEIAYQQWQAENNQAQK